MNAKDIYTTFVFVCRMIDQLVGTFLHYNNSTKNRVELMALKDAFVRQCLSFLYKWPKQHNIDICDIFVYVDCFKNINKLKMKYKLKI